MDSPAASGSSRRFAGDRRLSIQALPAKLAFDRRFLNLIGAIRAVLHRFLPRGHEAHAVSREADRQRSPRRLEN
jgi:hypothetical protein